MHVEESARVAVVMSGCGTSGRIAWLCSLSLQAILAHAFPKASACFRYLISGGDQSLVISNELPEDDPHAGAADLAAITKGCAELSMFS